MTGKKDIYCKKTWKVRILFTLRWKVDYTNANVDKIVFTFTFNNVFVDSRFLIELFTSI